MHIFYFEPGDGCSYRVIFGRIDAVAPRALVPGSTVFGIAAPALILRLLVGE